MTRFLIALTTLLVFCGCLTAQAQPVETKPDDNPTTHADLNDFLKRQYPGLDPAGEHDFMKIKNYSDGLKRFEYTRAMARVLMFYVNKCQFGALISKQFDATAKTEAKNQPTFNCLHAVVLLSYPEGRGNVMEAEKLLRAAIKLDPTYECPYFWLAKIEYERFRIQQATKTGVEDLLAKALLRPLFADALALKVRLLLTQATPDKAAARQVLEQMFEITPDDPETFQEMLGFFAECSSVGELVERVDALAKLNKFAKRYMAQAHAFCGVALMTAKEFEPASRKFETALTMVEVTEDPYSVIAWRFALGTTWATMALDLRSREPKLYGEHRTMFEKLVASAKANFELGAELERVHLPVDLRGSGALRYVSFLAEQIGEYEQAIEWLAKYIDRTSLKDTVYVRLTSLLLELRGLVQGDERSRIEVLKQTLEKEQIEKFVAMLGVEHAKVKEKGLHFLTGESQEFLSKLMSHQSREVAGLAAFLLADCAMQRKPEDVESAVNAILKRLEQESELLTAEQADFQQRLVQALLLFDKRGIDLRAIKELRRIVAASKETTLPADARSLIGEFSNETWVRKVFGDANRTLRSSHILKVERVKVWIDEAIIELEKSAKDK